MANSNGLEVANAGGNVIGGNTPKTRNVISGNSSSGIYIDDGSAGNQILGNLIGTDATGLKPLGNFEGISLVAAPGTAVGGPTPGAGNVISANSYGIYGYTNFTIGQGPDNSTVEGNFIGTDATGLAALGNTYGGVLVIGGIKVVIGGSLAGAANVISATTSGDGVDIDTNGVVIQGNFIGTNKTGAAALHNSGDGINISFANGVTIGGTSPGARNVISGNSGSGIALTGSNNLVQNNFIGTDLTGTMPLGNGSDGVTVSSNYSFFPAANNTIGGTVAGAGNLIAYNGGAGVNVLDPASTGLNVGNTIVSNQISRNAKLGIDLGGDGVTPNHLGGLIPGPNGYQNYPVLTAAVSSPGLTMLTGTLNAAASTSYTIQLFANTTADPSGFGQGQTYLGQVTMKTNASGTASFTADFPIGLAPGLFISATATDPSGNTSEFAQDITVVTAVPGLVIAPSTAAVSLDQAFESLWLGVLDEATISSMASVVITARSKPTL